MKILAGYLLILITYLFICCNGSGYRYSHIHHKKNGEIKIIDELIVTDSTFYNLADCLAFYESEGWEVIRIMNSGEIQQLMIRKKNNGRK